MSRYVEQATNKVRTFGQIRSKLKHVSFPAGELDGYDLSPYGYELLIETPRPTPPEGFEAMETDPIDNVQQWTFFPLAPEAIAAKAKQAEQRAVIDEAKADTMVQNFVAMDHAQVVNYIDTNVTDLASAKTFLKLIAKMMLIMAKRQYGG